MHSRNLEPKKEFSLGNRHPRQVREACDTCVAQVSGRTIARCRVASRKASRCGPTCAFDGEGGRCARVGGRERAPWRTPRHYWPAFTTISSPSTAKLWENP